MAEFKLHAGASIDLLTKQEVTDSLKTWWDAEQAARMRGVKWMRRSIPTPSVPTNLTVDGPESGYAWDLKMVSGSLTGNDSVAVYIGDDSSKRLIGYAGPPGSTPAQSLFVITWSSHQVVLMPGEGLYLATSGAFRFNFVMTAAVQVPAELLGKVLT